MRRLMNDRNEFITGMKQFIIFWIILLRLSNFGNIKVPGLPKNNLKEGHFQLIEFGFYDINRRLSLSINLSCKEYCFNNSSLSFRF
jgi:hypothetical protein